MPAPLRTSRADWLDAGLRALADGGPDAVRVEPVAAALGVTKGGFYHHFADRQALLDAMLARWEEQLVDRAIEESLGGGGDARDRLRALFAYAGSSPALMALELAVRDWARRDPAVATRLARVDRRRADFLRTLFVEATGDPDEAEARVLLTMSLFVGQAFVIVDHPGRPRAQVLARALRHLLA